MTSRRRWFPKRKYRFHILPWQPILTAAPSKAIKFSGCLVRAVLNEDVVSRAFSELREQAMSASDGEKLRHLVVEINLLLDIIERQLAKIDVDESKA